MRTIFIPIPPDTPEYIKDKIHDKAEELGLWDYFARLWDFQKQCFLP